MAKHTQTIRRGLALEGLIINYYFNLKNFCQQDLQILADGKWLIVFVKWLTK